MACSFRQQNCNCPPKKYAKISFSPQTLEHSPIDVLRRPFFLRGRKGCEKLWFRCDHIERRFPLHRRPAFQPGRMRDERQGFRPAREHRRALRSRRKTAVLSRVRPGFATRHPLRGRYRVHACDRGAGRRRNRGLSLVGRVRRGGGLRRDYGAPGGAHRPFRRGLRAHHGHLGRLYRGMHRGARPGRTCDARHAGSRLLTVSVRALRTPLSVQEGADAHRRGDPSSC